jgi:Animal haem peroxidase
MYPEGHGHKEPRGLNQRVPLSRLHEGRFGRMFRRLKPAPDLADDQLAQLAESMREPEPAQGSGGWGGPEAPAEDFDNPTVPAGFTYFGQFIDHDITFDPASSLQRENDPDALHDFRSPRFDLDSLYGSGPADEPFQYDKTMGGLKFLIEANRNGIEDLPRNSQDTALIGDPRNDENIIVSQLQLAFLHLHNKIADRVAADETVPAERKFEETQRLVRWHYQWVIVHDYLPRIVGQALVDELVSFEGPKADFKLNWYTPKVQPFMPVEFSVAAFRFGHSQIRPIYHLNEQVRDRPIFIAGDDVGELDDLRGFRLLPQGWTIDWKLFLEIDGATPQPSRKIDAKLTGALFDLPGFPDDRASLALRNLLRGQALNLPSGQDVARLLGAQVRSGADLGAPEPTPLWFYILKDSELGGGQQLGSVGARIVAEVLLGLLERDSGAWVNVDASWKPTLGPAEGQLGLADLVKFATT